MVIRLALLGLALSLSACAQRRLALPAEMRPVAATASQPAPSRQVLRMTEGGRLWEMELPPDGAEWEVRVPLHGVQPELTAADREGVSPDAPQKSLLTGLATVNELFTTRRYELALVELVELERQYPKEARVAAMKGTLYLKLGKKTLARESWSRALQADPEDRGTAEALRQLGED